MYHIFISINSYPLPIDSCWSRQTELTLKEEKESDDKSMNISGSNITLTQLLTGFSERFDMSWRQLCGRTAEPLTFSPGYPGGPGGPGGPWRNTDRWDKDVTITLNYNLLYGTSSPLKLLWHTLVNSCLCAHPADTANKIVSFNSQEQMFNISRPFS